MIKPGFPEPRQFAAAQGCLKCLFVWLCRIGVGNNKDIKNNTTQQKRQPRIKTHDQSPFLFICNLVKACTLGRKNIREHLLHTSRMRPYCRHPSSFFNLQFFRISNLFVEKLNLIRLRRIIGNKHLQESLEDNVDIFRSLSMSVSTLMLCAMMSAFSTAVFAQSPKPSVDKNEQTETIYAEKQPTVGAPATATTAVPGDNKKAPEATKEPEPARPESKPGDVVIKVTDAKGKPLNNISIRLVFPGRSGVLEKLPNILFEYRDKDKKHVNSYENGFFVINGNELKSYVKDGWKYRVEIARKGCASEKKVSPGFSTTVENYLEFMLKCQSR